MMRRITISFELDRDHGYDALIRRLWSHGAFPVLPSQWMLQTTFTVDEIKKDLQRYIDEADRLLITHVASMSSRNLINKDQFRSG